MATVLAVLTVAWALALAPLAAGQEATAEMLTFEADRMALPPSGGILNVQLSVRSTASAIDVVLELVPPGTAAGTELASRSLAPEQAGVLGTKTALLVEPRGAGGWWTLRVARATTEGPDGDRPITLVNARTLAFLVHDATPVAGLEAAPWPQSGGDAMHSGRTLALGPATPDVVRWTFEPQDNEPLHAPVIAGDGTIYVVTWGGELYALTQEGAAVWSAPLRLGTTVAYPPALAKDGSVIVAGEAGLVVAVRPDRGQAWTLRLREDLGALAPLSPPVVDVAGRTRLVREPWTLVGISESGVIEWETPLPAPLAQPAVDRLAATPLQGPPLAVRPNGDIVAIAGDGIAVVAGNGTQMTTVACGCIPRAVSLAPGTDVALITADRAVVAVSLATRQVLWSTEDRAETRLEDVVWSVPAIDWQGLVYIVSEDGQLQTLTLQGGPVRSRSFLVPLRSQPVLDGAGHIYFADACLGIRSLSATGTPRWTYEIDNAGCTGGVAGPVLTRSGALLWAAPDGELRMLGANRLPVAAFESRWDVDAFVFDAAASFDPDGSTVLHTWDFGDGSAPAHGFVVRHRFTRSGPAEVTLTVSDGIGSVTTAQTVVVDLPPRLVIVDESEGLWLTLNASQTADPEGADVRFEWRLDGQPAGTRPFLHVDAPAARVYRVEMSASDGSRASPHEQDLLAPAEASWRMATLALYDGCPLRVCSVPLSFQFGSGDLVILQVVNGAASAVEVRTGLPSVPGGVNETVLQPGEQQKLHLLALEGPNVDLVVTAVGGSSSTDRVEIDVRPAPSTITWRLAESDATPHAGERYPFRLLLEGPAPPADVSIVARLLVAGDEVAARRVVLDAGAPVNRTIELAFAPGREGDMPVTIRVESEDVAIASVLPAAGQDTVIPFTVKSPTFFSALSRTLSAHPLVTFGSLGLVVLALLAFVAVRVRRAPVGDVTPTRRAPIPGDATVAATFLPRKLDRFQIDRVLGEGGFGRTYLAHDQVLGRRVVLKELDAAAVGPSHDLLLHEARTAATLSHPNVVVVHDVIEEAGRLFIVMEFVEGGTLAERMAKGPLPAKQALTTLTDILHGLAALHAAGIVHRDLKPSNIVITHEGVAKITDFGVAARVETVAGTDGGAFIGTPRYMAPEQLSGKAPGPPADLYAAGAVLYEMLTGKHHLGVGVEAVPDAHELLLLRSNVPVHGLDPHLNHVLERALAREPEKRFASAMEFLDAVRRGK